MASELHFESNSNIVTAIESYLQQSPAVAVAVAVDDHVVYKKAVGHISTANRSEDTRVGTNDTAFLTASITKTFLALMTVQAMEKGILQLDQDINDFLTGAYDISFRNPHFPDVAITFRHLLTHSSSLDDNEHNLTQGSGWRTEGSDCTISLLEYVKQSYIDVSSPKYAPHVWNRHKAPGKARYHYSNAGFAVLGLALETATERSLQSFAQEYIFDPLFMNHTAFILAEIESKDSLKHIALPHNEKNQPIDHYGVAEWPAAQLRTTLEDLIHFLLAFTGSSYPSQLLSNPESLSLLMPESMTEGLAWWARTPPMETGGVDAGRMVGLWKECVHIYICGTMNPMAGNEVPLS
jgi:CubicO group peptidase (beta-lactamase class C family)